jgi:serine protease SohB
MIACTSSPGRLFAAPFAVLGSIGVIGQSFNIQKTLEGWGVKPLVFRGGRDKAPVGLIGEVTKEGLAKVQDMVDDTHRAFKRHVVSARPIIADRIEDLATGDVWLGYDALDVGLIDRIVTSDEYIFERMGQGARVLKLVQLIRPKFPFAPPTTSSMMNQARMTGSRSLVTVLDDFRSLLDRVSKSLGVFGVDDVHALTKAMTMNDIHGARTAVGSHEFIF